MRKLKIYIENKQWSVVCDHNSVWWNDDDSDNLVRGCVITAVEQNLPSVRINIVDKVFAYMNIGDKYPDKHDAIRGEIAAFVNVNAVFSNGSLFSSPNYKSGIVIVDNQYHVKLNSFSGDSGMPRKTTIFLYKNNMITGGGGEYDTAEGTGPYHSDNVTKRIELKESIKSYIRASRTFSGNEDDYFESNMTDYLRNQHYYAVPDVSPVTQPTSQPRRTQTQTQTINPTQMETTKTGVIFANTGDYGRDEIRGYHSKPSPIMRDKTKYPIDLVGVRRRDKARAIMQTDEGFVARYTIGFEVEKNNFDRGAVKEYPLFCGFENDGSCGVEAVTHILPLIPASTWRNKVFNMMYEAERVIDDTHSPSDDRCGGHITIGVKGMKGQEILDKVRKNSAIILAMFRHRLTNKYCGANVNMIDFKDNKYGKEAKRAIRGVVEPDSGSTRYQVALVKELSSSEGVVEFRLPSRIQNVRQMMNRYELMYELVNFSINRPTATYESFLKEVMPILERMYTDKDKLNRMVECSRAFNKMIRTGRINKDVKDFVDPDNKWERLYDKELLEITNGEHACH